MSKVRVFPPRGAAARGDQRIWTVDAIDGNAAVISTPRGAEIETVSVSIHDLVLVAEFRDRIYPGLRPDGMVERGDDKPFHTVINGENFHVLEQLTFTHEKSVDAIYIDPPYNTGARDWKYSNDYVAGDDLYRHSKWLAFMERRLKLAKRLLNTENSVLIVTIDEKEYLRLGLLLEQTFPEARVQMISIRIKPGGVARDGWFSRSDEFAFLVMLGSAAPSMLSLDKEWMTGAAETKSSLDGLHWEQLRRTGSSPTRSGHPATFYPIYVRADGSSIHSVGDPIGEGVDRANTVAPAGTVAVWPIRADGSEGRWQIGAPVLRTCLEAGYVKLGKLKGESAGLYFLSKGARQKVESGIFPIVGHRPDGSIIVDEENYRPRFMPTTQWVIRAHDSSRNGTNLLTRMLGGRKFPFPKSLYAVEDTLRFFVSNKPDAVILDFFAGSGTTAHAVMRLNKQDNGRRQCISVTNNEVSAEEQSKLYKQGLRPGDPEWEKWGICDYITKPRIRAAITGETPDGEPIKGDYKFVDEFPMADGFEENAAFFTLTYESKWLVGVDRAFAAIAPMLWLRAGAVGSRITSIEGGWAIADSYGILRDLDDSAAFVEALRERENIRIAYIVTDDEGRYQQVADEIRGIETVRLYEDYLRNCEMTGDF